MALATQSAARPQLVQPQGQKPEPSTIQSMLQNPKTVAKFQQVAPRHLNPERLLRVMAHAVYKTPKLAECQPITLLGAMMACASLGLEPNTPLGHAYLIPFEKRTKRGNDWVTESVDVNLIIGYRGYVDLARRSGSLVSIHADVVYEGDDFSFEYGSKMHLRHVPKGAREERPAQVAYAHARLTDGEAFEVLTYPEVLKIRDNAEGYKSAFRSKDKNARAWSSSPWVAFEHEMAAKTMIRRLSKMLPLSIEFANAAALDSMSEAGAADFSALSDGGVDMISFDPDQMRIQPSSETPSPVQTEPEPEPVAIVPEERPFTAVKVNTGAKGNTGASVGTDGMFEE